MTQNIYDRPEFFEGYSRLPRSVEGLDAAPEWPALRAMLPDMKGLRVVDLGCGYGWFSRWAREHGAARVLGLDVSAKMLERAKAADDDPAVAYEQADLETLALSQAAFDLAYSSLAFHYVEDAGRLYAQIKRALGPGGRLVFSTEHPIYMAAMKPGWLATGDGTKAWPVDHYFMEGPRTTDWLSAGVVKHHRTLGTTLELLLQAGFTLEHVQEFQPTAAQIKAAPSLADELQRPMFLLVSAQA